MIAAVTGEQQFLRIVNEYTEDVKKHMYPQRVASWKSYVEKALSSKEDLIILNNLKKAILQIANNVSNDQIMSTLKNGIDAQILVETELVKLAYFSKKGIDLYCANVKMNDNRKIFESRIRQENANFEEELCNGKTM